MQDIKNSAAALMPDSLTLINRYQDAYRIAMATIAIARIITFIGMVLGFIILISGLYASSHVGKESSIITIIATFIMSVINFILFYILGIIIASVGQMLRASLDTAVSISPFLTEKQKAEAMRLV